jgi:acetyl esterase/lipase
VASWDPYDPQGDYTRRSPVYHVGKSRTPTLILHGEDDLSTPLSQAVEFYNALVEAGCETELVVYPRAGQGWSEREHQNDSWNRTQRLARASPVELQRLFEQAPSAGELLAELHQRHVADALTRLGRRDRGALRDHEFDVAAALREEQVARP